MFIADLPGEVVIVLSGVIVFWRSTMSSRPLTKESLLNQVDTLRDIARRGRRLSETMELESDCRQLMAHMQAIEECATRIEKQAIKAKTFMIATLPQQKKSDWLG